MWWVYGIGLKGADPTWKPVEVIVGDLVATRNNEVAARTSTTLGRSCPPTIPARGQAVGVGRRDPDQGVEGLHEPHRLRRHRRVHDGGGTYPKWFFDFRHDPHYALVQVQPVEPQDRPSRASHRPRRSPTESQPVVSVVMIRDLGYRRMPAAFDHSRLARHLPRHRCWMLREADHQTERCGASGIAAREGLSRRVSPVPAGPHDAGAGDLVRLISRSASKLLARSRPNAAKGRRTSAASCRPGAARALPGAASTSWRCCSSCSTSRSCSSTRTRSRSARSASFGFWAIVLFSADVLPLVRVRGGEGRRSIGARCNRARRSRGGPGRAHAPTSTIRRVGLEGRERGGEAA